MSRELSAVRQASKLNLRSADKLFKIIFIEAAFIAEVDAAKFYLRSDIMNEDIFIIQLRDCFTAGYTLPQFCIDNNIKNPLFIAVDERRADFLWEICVQFMHDKRLKPKFSTLSSKENKTFRFSPGTLFNALAIENIRLLNFNDHDVIFFLSVQRFNKPIGNVIYLDELTNYFIFNTYIDIPLAHFLQRHPDIKFFLTNFTTLHPDPNNSNNENELLQKKPFLINDIRENLKKNPATKTPYDIFGYNRQEILDMLGAPKIKTLADGSTVFEENDNPLVNIKNGRRVTSDRPEKFINRIYFMGGCSHYGTGAPFDKTIPSCLQKMLNEHNLPYRVENVSQCFTYRYQDILYNLNTLPLQPDDIVIVFFDNFLSSKFPYIDVSKTFIRPHNYGEVFVDSAHVNEIGYKVLAEKFFQFLTQNDFFKNTKFEYPAPPAASSLRYSKRKFFHSYKKSRQQRIGTS